MSSLPQEVVKQPRMEENHPAHSGGLQRSRMRLSNHCEVFSLMLPEAFYTQLPSPEMTTFDPKRKKCKFIKSFAPVPLQLGKILQCPCPTLEGSHWVHFHLEREHTYVPLMKVVLKWKFTLLCIWTYVSSKSHRHLGRCCLERSNAAVS